MAAIIYPKTPDESVVGYRDALDAANKRIAELEASAAYDKCTIDFLKGDKRSEEVRSEDVEFAAALIIGCSINGADFDKDACKCPECEENREQVREMARKILALRNPDATGATCCKGLAPIPECRCERERKGGGHPPYQRSGSVAQAVPVADLLAVVEIANRNEYAPQIGRVKEWLSSIKPFAGGIRTHELPPLGGALTPSNPAEPEPRFSEGEPLISERASAGKLSAAAAQAQQLPEEIKKVLLIAEDVVWFDWSGDNNDADAIHAIDQLRIALSSVPSAHRAAPAVTFYCPSCKETSVADRDADGNCICPVCPGEANE